MSKWPTPSFSNKTLQKFPGISDLLSEVSMSQHHKKCSTLLTSSWDLSPVWWWKENLTFVSVCGKSLTSKSNNVISITFFTLTDRYQQALCCFIGKRRKKFKETSLIKPTSNVLAIAVLELCCTAPLHAHFCAIRSWNDNCLAKSWITCILFETEHNNGGADDDNDDYFLTYSLHGAESFLKSNRFSSNQKIPRIL